MVTDTRFITRLVAQTSTLLFHNATLLNGQTLFIDRFPGNNTTFLKMSPSAHVINPNNWKDIADADVAVVDFNAEWCGPCKRLAPVFEELAVAHHGKAKFFSVNVDDHPSIAEQENISGIPAIHVYKKGQRGPVMVGANPDNLKKLVADACK